MNAYRTAFLLSAAAAIASLGVAAASAWTGITGSGRPVTQQREVSGFNGVALSLPGRLEIVQGPSEGVTLTADDNLVAEIETVVEGGVLHVRFRKDLGATTRTRISVTVKARAIQSIAVAGSGDVVAATLESPELAVRLAGSGDVKLGGRAESLQRHAVVLNAAHVVARAGLDRFMDRHGLHHAPREAGGFDFRLPLRDCLDRPRLAVGNFVQR